MQYTPTAIRPAHTTDCREAFLSRISNYGIDYLNKHVFFTWCHRVTVIRWESRSSVEFIISAAAVFISYCSYDRLLRQVWSWLTSRSSRNSWTRIDKVKTSAAVTVCRFDCQSIKQLSFMPLMHIYNNDFDERLISNAICHQAAVLIQPFCSHFICILNI